MRKLAFKAVAQIFSFKILVINSVANWLLKVTGATGYLLMKLIDAKALSVYERIGQESDEPTELEAQNIELRLLASAVQVRDHAKANDDWTDKHTEALNAVGDALMFEAGWEEESVHQYLRSLVESIDGLEYGVED